MKIIKGQFNTAKIFATTIDESCETQILALCDESWVKDSQIRIMADCHAGKGCVIGTTMTITDKVVPHMVGVDINCGVLVTSLGKIDLDLTQVDKTIKRNIPMGKNSHQSQKVDISENLKQLVCKDVIDFNQVNKSIGSLGGGNHYIELDIDNEGVIYLVIHTGSRNFGLRVANHYQDKAIAYHSGKDSTTVKNIIDNLKAEGKQSEIASVLLKMKANIKHDMCYLEGDLFDAYMNDMKICQMMATLNRKTIADIIMRCLHLKPLEQFETIHNYIDIENKILRKGSISAQLGERCIIPINMRDGALICVGKGNPDYNYSAPHGAGRLMSRTKAKHELSLTEFKDTMQHVFSTTVNESTLDEAPMAYKPIAEILENIGDTVTVEKQIKPIYNIKAEE